MSQASWIPSTIAWLGLALTGFPALAITLAWFLLRRPSSDDTASRATTGAWLITMAGAVSISMAGHLMARAHVPWSLTRMTDVGVAKAQTAEEEERVRYRTIAVTLAGAGLLAAAFGWIPAIRNPGRPSQATRGRVGAAALICAASLGIYALVYWPPLARSFNRDPNAPVSYSVSNGRLVPRPTGGQTVPAAILRVPSGMKLIDFIDGPFREFAERDAMSGCVIELRSEDSKVEVRLELGSEHDLETMERPNDPTPIPAGRHALVRLREHGVMDISLNTAPLKTRRFQSATIEIHDTVTFDELARAVETLQANGYLRFGFSVRR